MKFVLFVEGHTEQKAVPAFFKRWLDPQLSHRVGIQPVRFEGWAELVDDVARKAHLYLEGTGRYDVIAVISLLDLYGPTFYPPTLTAASERAKWGKEYIEKKVNHPRFRHYFAVHETEAWLLSQPDLFPEEVRCSLPQKVQTPELVNFDEPPAYLLEKVYKKATSRAYKKVVYGTQLFAKLNPAVAYEKCPNLKLLLNEMLRLAKAAAG